MHKRVPANGNWKAQFREGIIETMYRQTPRPAKKHRTREHVLAELGVNFVERQVLLCGHSVERVLHDYGYDLLLFTYDGDGAIEPGVVFIQVKATDNLRVLSARNLAVIRIDLANLRSWLAEQLPVILVIYDASSDVAYWLHVQAQFPQAKSGSLMRARGQRTMHVPLAQRFDPEAVREIRLLKNRSIS